MNTIMEKYNEALQFVKLHRFDEAEQLLQSIIAQAPFHRETNYLLSVIKAATGNPIASLSYLERVDIQGIEERKEQIAGTLPLYEEVRVKYNESLDSAKKKHYEEAEKKLTEIEVLYHTIPLPIEIYILHILMIKVQGKDAKDFFASLPLYAKHCSSVRNLLQEKHFENKSFFKGRKYIQWALGVSALLLLVSSTLMYINEKKSHDAYKLVQAEQITDLENRIVSLTDEKGDLEVLLLENDQEQESQSFVFDASLDSIMSIEAEKAYKTGLQAYQNQNYEIAKEQFAFSLSLHSHQYYSDDAVYYLLKMKNTEGNLTSDDELFQLFNNTQLEHYQQSPYVDEVLLLKAETYLREEDMNLALECIDQLLKVYPQEWTGQKALSMKENIVSQ